MLYSFVNAQGAIVGPSKEFEVPPQLHQSKGRWISDVPPAYNKDMYTLKRIEPVPSIATSVEYEIVPIPVLEAKRVALTAVNQKRVQGVVAGFTFQGKLIDSDHASAVNIIGAAVAAQIASSRGVPFNVTWTCADNTTIDLDAEQMMSMMLEFAQHVNTVYMDARAKKTAINDTTASSVEDIIALV